MKRLVLLCTIVILAALLSGCELPDDWDKAWREGAYVNLSVGQLYEIFDPVIRCLVSIVGILAIFAVASNKGAYVGYMVLLLLIVLIPVAHPLLTLLSKVWFWREDYTLSVVMSRMGWTFPIPEGDLNPWTLTTAMGLTGAVPIVHVVFQFVVLALYVMGVISAIFRQKTKIMVIAVTAALGSLFFPVFHDLMTSFFEYVRPEGAIEGRIIATVLQFNALYIVGLFVLWIICYFLSWFFTLLWGPSLDLSEVSEKIGISSLAAAPAAILGGAGAASAPSPDDNGGSPGVANGRDPRESGGDPSYGQPISPDGDGDGKPGEFEGDDKLSDRDYIDLSAKPGEDKDDVRGYDSTSPDESPDEPFPGDEDAEDEYVEIPDEQPQVMEVDEMKSEDYLDDPDGIASSLGEEDKDEGVEIPETLDESESYEGDHPSYTDRIEPDIDLSGFEVDDTPGDSDRIQMGEYPSRYESPPPRSPPVSYVDRVPRDDLDFSEDDASKDSSLVVIPEQSDQEEA